ncbi:MAG TPA: malto-oligosyltrehalose synthase [Rhizomicrobium sp.]|nr:malto-oligosyltrehalose synthase [Rhizomicrobium sp.]
MIPRATYRLQFHKDFPFARAADLAEYFQSLGISHVYASPILTARAGSTHGYNVIDFGRINPELGGEEQFRHMAAALRAHDIGIILDTVPNHMAVGKADNPWWLDVLKNGRTSRYSAFFDIDWDALDGKVLAPFLNGAPEALLEHGELKLVRDAAGTAFVYYDNRFPVRDDDAAKLDDVSALSLHDKRLLLRRQHYALADWHEADARINWRRFFNITELAALRMENDDAFDAVHAKTLALYEEGLVDGLRIDHVDGLSDPRAYCRKLRAALQARQNNRPPELQSGEAYLIVEKILADHEGLPDDWLVDGTTGYDFMEDVSALIHADDSGALAQAWSEISGRSADFETEELLARPQLLNRDFESLRDAAVRALALAADAPKGPVREGFAAIITHLRCYRTYATGCADSPPPGACFEAAVAAAKSTPDAAETVARILRSTDGRRETIDAVRRFNQLAAPVAAKAVEDTAFYRYGRLISRNDVGFDPRITGISADEFHRRVAARAAPFPHAMLTTATHDHKRGEDARARLAVLSEIPGEWNMEAERWLTSAPRALDRGDVYQLLQTLVGVWPCEPFDDPAPLAQRVETGCRKFLREGKLRSSWAAPDEAYERAFIAFARALLDNADFRGSMDRFIVRIAPQAIANSLAQIVLRMTVPGVPDLYQGRERWDFSLVDPDNRSPVDYATRRASQGGVLPLGANPEGWRDGRQKQALISRLLHARRLYPDVFANGSYEPIEITGSRTGSAIAFRRRSGPRHAIIAAALHCADALVGHEEIVPPTNWWGDSGFAADLGNATAFREILTDTTFDTAPKLVADLFGVLPVSVLVSV